MSSLFRAVVKLGEHNLETKIDCENDHCADPPQIIEAKAIVIPKEYDELNYKHDIAIIELSRPANITHYVSPICLPTGDLTRDNLMREVVEVAGWGWYDVDDPKSPPVLQVVKLPVVDMERCKKIKQLEQLAFNKGQLCVGGVAGKGRRMTRKRLFVYPGWLPSDKLPSLIS